MKLDTGMVQVGAGNAAVDLQQRDPSQDLPLVTGTWDGFCHFPDGSLQLTSCLISVGRNLRKLLFVALGRRTFVTVRHVRKEILVGRRLIELAIGLQLHLVHSSSHAHTPVCSVYLLKF